MKQRERKKFHEDNCKPLKYMGVMPMGNDTWIFCGLPYAPGTPRESGTVYKCAICGVEIYMEKTIYGTCCAYSVDFFENPNPKYWINKTKIKDRLGLGYDGLLAKYAKYRDND